MSGRLGGRFAFLYITTKLTVVRDFSESLEIFIHIDKFIYLLISQQALLFIEEYDLPAIMHLHTGNIILQNFNCR